ncbi:ABC transporter permease [Lactiplantibacillus garii]|uniref:ABC transporter permease n=1 Tax=Lactiplantibacillus garii TaxID=2306423 RepID=A0A426D4B8_9LACO|nr:ABC transporter permease [Lactiplantibacillus garii]RRK09431.1 ABC transporter permease [Lactiplantibacillus garii]
MSTKLRATTRYLLIDQLKMLGAAALTIIGLFMVLPFLFALVSGNLGNFSFSNTFGNFSWGFLLGMFLFIANSLTYDSFKLLIQNGISRKTFWSAKVLVVLMIAFAGELVSALYYYGISAPLRGLSMHAALMNMPYSLYANFFGSNVLVNVFASLIFNAIFLTGVGLTGMAVGSILALFSKWTQRIVIVVTPILGLFLLGFLISTTNTGDGYSSYDFTGFVNFLKFLVGYPQHGPATTGYFNPAMPTITMLIGCAIVGAIAYFFNQKLKIKN